ncbi:SurA N-terminal domain-containing protein [Bradyrhizobium sp.]|uniref:SurA N-terminal domain-containing protein n=1 Tax=Bradyrhizobium sp. TaxID=376 RepID=UPI001D1B2C8F|nr:SurA N-terminal domain-containing protein [Bradyrhizobium sp.]MBI5319234.1 SurA N-terminal domain-containing protein [Bradyrhizobium sp.]
MPSLRLSTLLATILLAAIGCSAPAHAQTVVVMVNGEPITSMDIEQRSKLTLMTTRKQPTRDEVISDLIDEKVKIREAKRFGVDPTSTDIDQSYAAMAQRMRLSPDQLTQVLEKQGVRPDTLRSRIKADMVWGSLVRGRYKESLQVGEKDVAAAVREKGDELLEVDASEYKMQPVVLIVPRGSPPTAYELRKKEAEALRERVTSCAEANSYFKSMQNAAIRDIVTKTSADLPQVLRDMLEKTPVGRLTPPEQTKQGIEMVALCARNKTTIDTPKKKEIREKMFVEKYEAKSKSYLQQVRKSAMIEYR